MTPDNSNIMMFKLYNFHEKSEDKNLTSEFSIFWFMMAMLLNVRSEEQTLGSIFEALKLTCKMLKTKYSKQCGLHF